MGEYAENLGRRVEAKQERLRMAMSCVALRDQLRRLLPLDVDPAELDAETLLATAVALNQACADLAAIDRRIGIYDGMLGGK